MRATARRPRSTFGVTWWGRAWVDALEQRARLDPNRLPRGRTYARSGRAEQLRVGRGEVTAAVWGSRGAPYDVRLRVRPFDEAEWGRLLDAVASRAAHAAALLDGELTPEVAADAAEAGVELLPGPGELGPRCSCPDWADPCKHAAAVCYLVAEVLDGDPFALLLLRGRTRGEVLAGLRSRRSTRATSGGHATAGDSAQATDPGVEARAAWAAWAAWADGPPPVSPQLPGPPEHPGLPATLALDPPPGAGVRGQDLRDLATDAARRAWALGVGEGDGGLGLDPALDLARLAEARLSTGGFGELAARAGVARRRLAGDALAWRHGGAGAVEVRSQAWSPGPDALAAGVRALGPRARTWRNRVTAADGAVQLRLGRDGLWYRCLRAQGTWELDGPPDLDPVTLAGVPATGTGPAGGPRPGQG